MPRTTGAQQPAPPDMRNTPETDAQHTREKDLGADDAQRAPTRRGEERRQAVLDAALELFLKHGFAATSLDRVIERAGGSRRIIYQTYGGKEGLLEAVVSQGCQGIIEQLDLDSLLEMPPADALSRIGDTFLDMLTAPRKIALLRLVTAESTHAPELGRQFMAAGPERGYKLILSYFRGAMEAGKLSLPDPETSARQFLELVKGDLTFRVMFYGDVPDKATRRRYVDAAVTVFLQGARVDTKGPAT